MGVRYDIISKYRARVALRNAGFFGDDLDDERFNVFWDSFSAMDTEDKLDRLRMSVERFTRVTSSLIFLQIAITILAVFLLQN